MVSYAVAHANDAISRLNHTDPNQRPTMRDLVGVIQDLRTELHIREALEEMTNQQDRSTK